MRLLSGVAVAWDGGVVSVPAGSLIMLDPAVNTVMLAAYGGAGNLQDVSALPGDGTAIDATTLSN
jgi:hypothetical protein